MEKVIVVGVDVIGWLHRQSHVLGPFGSRNTVPELR
jgi:hypothetical protein